MGSKIKELADKDRYGIVKLHELHDAMGKPPLPQFHKEIHDLWSKHAISIEAHEGRHGISDREKETAMHVEGKPHTSLYITDRSKL